MRVCGTDLLDSGAAGGFRIVNVRKDGGWARGTPLVIDLGDGAPGDLRFNVKLGDARQGVKFSIGDDARHPGVTILSGAAIYYAFDVMWDGDRQQVLLRPRSGAAVLAAAPINGG